MQTQVINIRSTDKYTKYIGRPSRWGNPFPITEYLSREQAINKFANYAQERLKTDPDWLEPLRGEVLGCFCKPLSCHGDVIIELLGNGKKQCIGYKEDGETLCGRTDQLKEHPHKLCYLDDEYGSYCPYDESLQDENGAIWLCPEHFTE